MAWRARTLRLTLFPEEGAGLDRLPSWAELASQDPETQMRREGRQEEDGPYEEGRLVVVKHPLRFDLIYTVKPPPEPMPTEGTGVRHLGDLRAARAVFRRLAEHVLERQPSARRLAFGRQLVHPVADRKEAYAFLRDCIATTKFDLQEAEDFLYQVNRPRVSSRVPELRVNRLSKWTAVREQIQYVDADTGQVARRLLGTTAQLETDINTDAERRTSLPQGALVGLLEELVSLSDEIADRGDVR